MRTFFMKGGLVAAMVLAASVALAQAPAPAQPAKPGAPSVTPVSPAPPATAPGTTPAAGAANGGEGAAPEPYSYNPEGRRDPFVSLIMRGIEAQPGKRSDGLASLTTAELVVRGVLNSKGAYIALVAGPDGKTYTAHVNDRVVDGTIRSITPQGLVIVQEVNDPLSLIKQREVRKGLRASEDGK